MIINCTALISTKKYSCSISKIRRFVHYLPSILFYKQVKLTHFCAEQKQCHLQHQQTIER